MRNPFERRGGRHDQDPEAQEYWLSYSDVMAGLLMVFVLMLLAASTRYNTEAEELENLRNQVSGAIETMAVRDSIIRDLLELNEEGEAVINVDTITGVVRLSDAVLFDEGEYVLRPRGEAVLSIFAENYLPVVSENEQYRDHLREIAVEGHTNDNGPYAYNMRLSQNRAFAVMEYFFEITEDPRTREFLERYLTARGRSESQVICMSGHVGYPSDCGPNGVDKSASRRIEIQFRLDDEEVVREVKSLLEE